MVLLDLFRYSKSQILGESYTYDKCKLITQLFSCLINPKYLEMALEVVKMLHISQQSKPQDSPLEACAFSTQVMGNNFIF